MFPFKRISQYQILGPKNIVNATLKLEIYSLLLSLILEDFFINKNSIDSKNTIICIDSRNFWYSQCKICSKNQGSLYL